MAHARMRGMDAPTKLTTASACHLSPAARCCGSGGSCASRAQKSRTRDKL